MDSIFRSKAHELQSFIRSRIKDEKLKDKIDNEYMRKMLLFENSSNSSLSINKINTNSMIMNMTTFNKNEASICNVCMYQRCHCGGKGTVHEDTFGNLYRHCHKCNKNVVLVKY